MNVSFSIYFDVFLICGLIQIKYVSMIVSLVLVHARKLMLHQEFRCVRKLKMRVFNFCVEGGSHKAG